MGAVTGVANELGGKLMDDNFKIIELPKENWKGVTIPLVTKSDSFYDLIMEPLDDSGCKISLIRKKSEKEIVHTPEEYDFPDSLYQEHWEKAEAYGVVSDQGDIKSFSKNMPDIQSSKVNMITTNPIQQILRMET